jgi:hypothetical protein
MVIARLTKERDGLIIIYRAFLDVVTTEQFAEVRARLAAQDLTLVPRL